MFILITAAIITFTGFAGFVISSLVSSFTHAPAASDVIFNTSAVFLVAGPLAFFGYVILGMGLEFIRINRPPKVRAAAPAPSVIVPAVLPRHVPFEQSLPEGLRRQPKGPMNPGTGRASAI